MSIFYFTKWGARREEVVGGSFDSYFRQNINYRGQLGPFILNPSLLCWTAGWGNSCLASLFCLALSNLLASITPGQLVPPLVE